MSVQFTSYNIFMYEATSTDLFVCPTFRYKSSESLLLFHFNYKNTNSLLLKLCCSYSSFVLLASLSLPLLSFS